jgi:hypothetical protein
LYLTVVGIDPGKRIGLGVASGTGSAPTSRFGEISEDPMEVWQHVLGFRDDYLKVAQTTSAAFFVTIENYVGSGHRNKDQALTERYVGWFNLACRWWDIDHALSMPDARRWKLQQAADALGKKLSYAPTAHDDDDISALAHALSRYDKIRRTN